MVGRESQRLEREARQIVEEARGGDGLHVHVARELALALQALEQRRALYHVQDEQLLQEECLIGTELARIEHLSPTYSRLEASTRARLLAVAAERRRLTATMAEQEAAHHRHLLDLVHRYRLLDPDAH